MGNDFSIIKISAGDVSVKAGQLLDKVVAYFWPSRIIQRAIAEGDAKRIQALAELDIERMRAEVNLEPASDLPRRAQARAYSEEIRHQENMERITALALPLVTNDAEPEKISDDWIERFFDRSRGASDAEVRILWARILAGQANRPGSISKRTLDFLGSMEREEGEAFAKLLNFSVEGFGEDRVLIVANIYDRIYSDNHLTFATLSHLQSIGLIVFDSFKALGFLVEGDLHHSFARYFTNTIVAEWSSVPINLPIGQAFFTQVGRELSTVCEPVEVEGFADYLAEFWRTGGAIKVHVQPVEPAIILSPQASD